MLVLSPTLYFIVKLLVTTPTTAKRLYLGMRNGVFILLVPLLGLGCSQKHRIHKPVQAIVKCKSNWEYFNLIQPLKGKVVLHTKGYCGYFHTHANTIITINNNDTIRVDGPCYTENIVPSDSVLVKPYKTDLKDATIGDLKYDCTIRKTCYGIITKIK